MTTRRRPIGSPPPQERYASSRAVAPGILANLAAKAIATAPDRSTRGILWWIQWRSWQADGLTDLCNEIRSVAGSTTTISGSQLAPLLTPEASEEVKAQLQRFCLDPNAIKETFGSNLWAWMRPHLEALQSKEKGTAKVSIAATSVAAQIWQTLDEASISRGSALMVGHPLTGKATSARAWCRASCGLARFVETPTGNDVGALLRAIADALGTASGSGYKVNQVEDRVLQALDSGEIMLVFNNAHWLWPSGDVRLSYPRRLDWLLSIINRPNRVPVAMLATRQWSESRRVFAEVFGWAVHQFEGHLDHVRLLPEELSKAECTSIAEKLLPEAPTKAHSAIGGFAYSSPYRGAGVISSIVRDALENAKAQGLSSPDRRCIAEAIERSLRSEAALQRLDSNRRSEDPSHFIDWENANPAINP